MNIVTPNKALAVICITPNGKTLVRRLASLTACDCYTSEALLESGFQPLQGGFSQGVTTLFKHYSALLFICASGIVVRTIAPLLQDKLNDPAVLVMDEQGQNIISLLSGHIGGANALTKKLAQLTGANPVITTATDVNQVAALDMIATHIDATMINFRDSAKMINQMLVSGKRIGLYQQDSKVDDQRGFILINDIKQLPPLDALVWVSMANKLPPLPIPVVQLIPRRVVAGIGCRRGIEFSLLENLLLEQLASNHLHPLALKAIGSVALKQDEAGLMLLAEHHQVPFQLFSTEQLKPHQDKFQQSPFVTQVIGIGNVSQPVAWLMSNGNLCGETLKQQGITITLGVNLCCTL